MFLCTLAGCKDKNAPESFNGNIDLPQGLEEITNEKMQKCENVKIIKDGLLLIEKNGKIYTVTGQQVR